MEIQFSKLYIFKLITKTMNTDYNYSEPENYIEFSSYTKTNPMKKLITTIKNILAIAGAN